MSWSPPLSHTGRSGQRNSRKQLINLKYPSSSVGKFKNVDRMPINSQRPNSSSWISSLLSKEEESRETRSKYSNMNNKTMHIFENSKTASCVFVCFFFKFEIAVAMLHDWIHFPHLVNIYMHVFHAMRPHRCYICTHRFDIDVNAHLFSDFLVYTANSIHTTSRHVWLPYGWKWKSLLRTCVRSYS